MESMEDIKGYLLSGIEWRGLTEMVDSNPIREAYSADTVLDALTRQMDALVYGYVVNGKWLQEAFSVKKLEEKQIYVGNDSRPVKMKGQEAWFFGERKCIMNNDGMYHTGHFYEYSSVDCKDGIVALFGHASGVLRGLSEGHAYGDASIEVRDCGDVSIHNRAVARLYNNSHVLAYDYSFATLNDLSAGYCRGKSRFFARNNACVTPSENASGVVRDAVTTYLTDDEGGVQVRALENRYYGEVKGYPAALQTIRPKALTEWLGHRPASVELKTWVPLEHLKTELGGRLSAAGLTQLAESVGRARNAEQVLEPLLPFMDRMVRTGAVDGKSLGNWFTRDGLDDRGVFLDDGHERTVWLSEGNGYFFGKVKGILDEPGTVGHFYDESTATVTAGQAFLHDTAKGVISKYGKGVAGDHTELHVQDEGIVYLHDRARAVATDSAEVTLRDDAFVQAYGNARVYAFDRATGEMNDLSVGRMYNQSNLTICGFADVKHRGEKTFEEVREKHPQWFPPLSEAELKRSAEKEQNRQNQGMKR